MGGERVYIKSQPHSSPLAADVAEVKGLLHVANCSSHSGGAVNCRSKVSLLGTADVRFENVTASAGNGGAIWAINVTQARCMGPVGSVDGRCGRSSCGWGHHICDRRGHSFRGVGGELDRERPGTLEAKECLGFKTDTQNSVFRTFPVGLPSVRSVIKSCPGKQPERGPFSLGFPVNFMEF